MTEVARTAFDLTHLSQPPGNNGHTRPNRISVAMCTDEFDTQPLRRVDTVISQNGRRVFEVGDNNVDIPIVINITEGSTSTYFSLCYRCVRVLRKIDTPVTEKKLIRLCIRTNRIDLRDIVIQMTVGNKQIQPAVIVKIAEIDTPRQIRKTPLTDPLGETHLGKEPTLCIVIEAIRLILKIRNHDIEIAIVVKIAEVCAHPAIGTSFLTERNACEKCVLRHLNTIPFVAIEKIRRSIVRNKDINISIVIYITTDNA